MNAVFEQAHAKSVRLQEVLLSPSVRQVKAHGGKSESWAETAATRPVTTRAKVVFIAYTVSKTRHGKLKSGLTSVVDLKENEMIRQLT